MMSNNGLSKLIEESGEVLQITGKILAYLDGNHPDGKGYLYDRLALKIADLSAAIAFVVNTHDLDATGVVSQRLDEKLALFNTWHADKDN